MTSSGQSNLKNIKETIIAIFRASAEHLFLTSLLLIFISLLLGAAVFYKYNIIPQRIEPELGQGVIKFDEAAYQGVLQEWQDREASFETAKTKLYPDLFK